VAHDRLAIRLLSQILVKQMAISAGSNPSNAFLAIQSRLPGSQRKWLRVDLIWLPIHTNVLINVDDKMSQMVKITEGTR
jgi:hypothetical protein